MHFQMEKLKNKLFWVLQKPNKKPCLPKNPGPIDVSKMCRTADVIKSTCNYY